jgi:hypothetical protein
MSHLRTDLRFCILLGIALADPLTIPISALQITIDLHDYAGVEPAMISKIEDFATGVFDHAGVETRWRHCRFPVTGRTGASGCTGPSDRVADLVVRILPEHMSCKVAPRPQQFGLSIPMRETTHSRDAHVFLDRIVNLAKDRGIPWPPLVGATLAHEMGHLLLGNNSHFASGLMFARWRPEELQRILTGRLVFTPRQAALLRSQVSQRIKSRE